MQGERCKCCGVVYVNGASAAVCAKLQLCSKLLDLGKSSQLTKTGTNIQRIYGGFTTTEFQYHGICGGFATAEFSSATLFAAASQPPNSSTTVFAGPPNSSTTVFARFRSHRIPVPRYLRWFCNRRIPVQRYLRWF